MPDQEALSRVLRTFARTVRAHMTGSGGVSATTAHPASTLKGFGSAVDAVTHAIS